MAWHYIPTHQVSHVGFHVVCLEQPVRWNLENAILQEYATVRCMYWMKKCTNMTQNYLTKKQHSTLTCEIANPNFTKHSHWTVNIYTR
jgi:hypothetical protein